jgi:hypothetical protein
LQARQEALQRKLRDQMSVDEAQKLFAEINEQCRQQSTMWSDDAFPASDVSLYIGGSRRFDTQSTIHMVNVSRWLRPCEYCDADLPPVLCEPDRGYDIFQLQQGSIGDCYLISAIGVCALRKDESSTTNVTSSTAPDGDVSGSGSAVAAQPEFVENQTMRALISPAVYNPNGIYLVRFFKQGKEIPVLIDDRLPCWAAAGLETEPGRTQCADSPCFVRSRSIGEIWPSLIEKAYAKLHGSYEVIEAGKVHHALVDITNGASDEIRIDSAEVRANIDSFWERLSTFHRAGYLLACGSNAGRDTHDDGGIFMGHAYAILRLYCEDDLRLIELRNPWGRGEWRGDWSDKSPLWTKRLRTVLNVSDVDDGVFWMSFPDFMQKFANIFVCRLMRRPPVMVSGLFARSSFFFPPLHFHHKRFFQSRTLAVSQSIGPDDGRRRQAPVQ